MKEIELRSVVEKDALIILNWANDPLTRRMSFNTEPISKKEHSRWFSKQLMSPSRRLFIATYQKTPMGLCRFQQVDSKTWEIGINLCPEFRKRKLSIHVLISGCDAIRSEFPGCRIIAHTRPENFPFRSIAKAAGFKEIGSTFVNNQKAVKLVLN